MAPPRQLVPHPLILGTPKFQVLVCSLHSRPVGHRQGRPRLLPGRLRGPVQCSQPRLVLRPDCQHLEPHASIIHW